MPNIMQAAEIKRKPNFRSIANASSHLCQPYRGRRHAVFDGHVSELIVRGA